MASHHQSSTSIAIPSHAKPQSTTNQLPSLTESLPSTPSSTLSSSSTSLHNQHHPFAPARRSPLAMSVSASADGGMSQRAKEKSRAVVGSGDMGEEEAFGTSPGGSWSDSPFVRRRRSLMGAALEKTECIVVEVGSPEAPRLISCVSSSQGFAWNRAIFLPPYLARDEDLQIKQDPIADVVVSEEEARGMLPEW